MGLMALISDLRLSFTICTVKKRWRYIGGQTDRQTRAILMPPDCLHWGAKKSINGDENKIMATFLFIGHVKKPPDSNHTLTC